MIPDTLNNVVSILWGSQVKSKGADICESALLWSQTDEDFLNKISSQWVRVRAIVYKKAEKETYISHCLFICLILYRLLSQFDFVSWDQTRIKVHASWNKPNSGWSCSLWHHNGLRDEAETFSSLWPMWPLKSYWAVFELQIRWCQWCFRRSEIKRWPGCSWTE